MSKLDQSGKINVKSMPMGQTQFFTYDLKTNWVEEILKEAQSDSTPDPDTKSYLEVDIEVTRHQAPTLGDYLVVEGKLKSVYQVPCVRCLENAVVDMDTNFSVCVMDENLEDDEAFQGLDSYILNDKEYQLYYTEKRQFDLHNCIHEQYFMNTEYLPLHNENCLGLCPECGINKNLESCKHETKQ